MGVAVVADPSEFYAAYDAVLARWPVAVEAVDVPSAYGTTRVNVCGPVDAPPLVLLHGGGATSTVWFNNVKELGSAHRVFAVDLIGDVGRSVHDGQRLRSADDLMAWLDGLFLHLGIDHAHLAGHSYGGWIALSYALHAPARVGRLALLDPSFCFAGLTLGYRLRAIPLMARPTAERVRSFITWECGDIEVDATWLNMTARGAAAFPSRRIVMPHRPRADLVRTCKSPTLVLLAERSKSHDIGRVADTARRLMPDVATAVLPDASHHSIPTENATELNRRVRNFLENGRA